MDDMIERVARALASDIEARLPFFTAQKWEDLSLPVKATLLHRAKVAIEAMREPTEAMLENGRYAIGDLEADVSKSVYQAMIDAALKPSPQ